MPLFANFNSFKVCTAGNLSGGILIEHRMHTRELSSHELLGILDPTEDC